MRLVLTDRNFVYRLAPASVIDDGVEVGTESACVMGHFRGLGRAGDWFGAAPPATLDIDEYE
jgi:hypothetical protein